jgi:hypothetical protein
MPARLTTEVFIQRAKGVHGDKYDYSEAKYSNATTNVQIRCPVEGHGVFEQTPNNHVKCGCGCPQCSITTTQYNTTTFIKKSNLKHNNKYDYSKTIYKNFQTKISIICKIKDHGLFRQAPKSHINGTGCPKCLESYCDTTIFITKAKVVHGNKYNYDKTVYKSGKNKVVISCKIHGEFLQRAYNHLNGQGCKSCGYIQGPGTTLDEFIIKAHKKHNNKYDYSQSVYKNSVKKIKIICPINNHGIFHQSPTGHLTGNGCSKCLLWRTFGKLCSYCKPNSNIKKKVYEKSKELKVVKYLKEHLPDHEFIHNKSVGSSCTKNDRENTNGHLFPDIRFDCGFFQLIVEVDEHQHRGAEYSCDKRRMYDIE